MITLTKVVHPMRVILPGLGLEQNTSFHPLRWRRLSLSHIESCHMDPRHILASYLRGHGGRLHQHVFMVGTFEDVYLCDANEKASCHNLKIMDPSHLWNGIQMAQKCWVPVAMGVYGKVI